ncbi:XcyI family restriction endonuclease [Desulfonatronum lacustre]|uniref:XcyI family restriction endonuclease n=1 Tax=Desulfonatronum lacustre TaxID=66849 RepID=UPI00048E40C5|nr:XcyI family restriction endonuclease [Desulfonatronum lacustre]
MFKIPEPDLQIAFFTRLQELRRTHLRDALLDTVASMEIPLLDEQLASLVAAKDLRTVAAWGLRGEIIFAVPALLERNPLLLGYYRLLLGFSQKQFYGNRYEFAPFKIMEEHGRIPANRTHDLRELCAALCVSAGHLINNVDRLSIENVHELTLLTLGPQLRGGALNALGSKATRKVFDLISDLLASETVAEGERSLEIQNASGRLVRIEFASDPDICIREELPSGRYRNLVAIEIKGGRDHSNIHNRIGEAEKSHQKARKDGYVECWTMVGVARLDVDLAKRESPCTDRFYHIDHLTRPDSEEHLDFRENLLSRIGIKA